MYGGFDVDAVGLPHDSTLEQVQRYLNHLTGYVLPSEHRRFVVVNIDTVPATYGEGTWDEVTRALVQVNHPDRDHEYYADCHVQAELLDSPGRPAYTVPRWRVTKLQIGRWVGRRASAPRNVVDITKSTHMQSQKYADASEETPILGFPVDWWRLFVAEVSAAVMGGKAYPQTVEENFH